MTKTSKHAHQVFKKLFAAAKRLGLDRDLIFFACVVGDPNSIKELSLFLLEKLEERKALKGEGSPVRVKHAISDSTVDGLAFYMLSSAAANDQPPPQELVALFRERLGIESWQASHFRKARQRYEASIFYSAHPDAGLREIARAVNVSPSTVRGWLDDPSFTIANELKDAPYFRFKASANGPLRLLGPDRKRPPVIADQGKTSPKERLFIDDEDKPRWRETHEAFRSPRPKDKP